MNKGISFSLRAKIITMVIATLLMAMVSAMYLIRSLVYQNIIDQKMTTVDILTASLVHDIKYEYIADSHTQHFECIKDLISKYITYYRIIESISFFDQEFINRADSDPEKLGEVTIDEDIIKAIAMAKPSLKVTGTDRANLRIRSISPILRGSKIIGVVVTKVSIQDIESTMSAIDRRITTILILTILMAGLVLFLLMQGTIIKRLNKLMQLTRHIATGNYEIQVKDERNDELGELGKAFDQMTEELLKSKREIDNYHQHLEAKVKEATAQLNIAYEDLKNTQGQLVLNEKMASLGILIAGIAHEINTPVSAMQNIARNLEQKITSMPEDIESLLNQNKAFGDHLADCLRDLIRSSSSDQAAASFQEVRMIEAILKEEGIKEYRKVGAALVHLNFTDKDKIKNYLSLFRLPSIFSLIESIGNISQAAKIAQTSSRKIEEIVRALKYYAYTDKDKVEMIQLNESINTALILLRNKLRHLVTVNTEFDPHLPKIPCTSEVHQIWTNLLNNSYDAIEDMGEGYQGEIIIRTQKVQDRITITIMDNGSGIPEDKIGKIFDPFFTTKDIGKGTGLGLSIVTGIIKKHEGLIRVESSPGQTSFEISFPIKGEAESDLYSTLSHGKKSSSNESEKKREESLGPFSSEIITSGS